MEVIRVKPTNDTINDTDIFFYNDAEIQLMNEQKNKSLYTNYELTPIQFSVERLKEVTEIVLNYKSSFRDFKARHIIGLYFDEITQKWNEVKTSINEKDGLIQIVLPENTELFSFALNKAWYSDFTMKVAKQYPLWTEIKNNKESIGQQFLNFFGIEIEEIHDWINWSKEQKYVDTLDVYQVDYVFMYELPFDLELDQEFAIKTSEGQELNEIESSRKFLERYKDRGFVYDIENRKILTRRNYGNLYVEYAGKMVSLQQQFHHIWNSIDEMALLFGIMRVEGESNKNLQQRIKEVFKYPSGSHKMGVLYGIARDLLLMNRKVWKNDYNDFYIKVNGQYIEKESIHIDHKPLSYYKDRIQVDFYSNGDIRIRAMKTGETHTINFIKGISFYELYDKDNEELNRMMFNSDGQASNKLFKWINEIKQISPIMWDQTQWDKNYWDTVNKESTGLGYVPNQWDSTLDAWSDK